MIDHSALFREYLVACNIQGVRRLWQHHSPHLPQPNGDYEVQVVIHVARTRMESIPIQLRLYSHQWLLENNLPSHLPDVLKPPAERIGSKFAKGVGIAVMTDDPSKVEAAKAIQKAMGDAVEGAFADGRTDTPFLRQRMDEARDSAIRRMGGPQIKVDVFHSPIK